MYTKMKFFSLEWRCLRVYNNPKVCVMIYLKNTKWFPPQFCLHQLRTLRTNHLVIYLRWERVTLDGKIDLKAMHLVTCPTPQSLLNFRFSLPLTSITAFISQWAPNINSCPNSSFFQSWSQCSTVTALCLSPALWQNSQWLPVPAWGASSAKPFVVRKWPLSRLPYTLVIRFPLVIWWTKSPKPENLNRHSYALTRLEAFL